MNTLSICTPALIVGIIGLVNTLADVHMFGLQASSFVVDIIMTILFALLTTWFCSKNWMTLSWLICIILTLLTFSGLYLYRIKDPAFMKDIEETKKEMKKK
jgi:hypothetical protein